MARRKKITDEEFMNQPIDFASVVRVQGKVPGRAEAVTLAKMKKESRFTARVSQQDFEDFKKISAKKGVGYQTLLGSLIHQYISSSHLVSFADQQCPRIPVLRLPDTLF